MTEDLPLGESYSPILRVTKLCWNYRWYPSNLWNQKATRNLVCTYIEAQKQLKPIYGLSLSYSICNVVEIDAQMKNKLHSILKLNAGFAKRTRIYVGYQSYIVHILVNYALTIYVFFLSTTHCKSRPDIQVYKQILLPSGGHHWQKS